MEEVTCFKTDIQMATAVHGLANIIKSMWFEGPVIPFTLATEDDTLESESDISNDENAIDKDQT